MPPRAHLAGGLLAGGIAAGFALVPLGGWVSGGGRLVRGAALAPWALLLLPALLLTTQPLQTVLPAEARLTFAAHPAARRGGQRGVGRAAWPGVADADRYARVLLADLGLVAMGLATPAAGARLGSLLLMLTHLCVGPLLRPRARVVVVATAAGGLGGAQRGAAQPGLLGPVRPGHRARPAPSGERCCWPPSRWSAAVMVIALRAAMAAGNAGPPGAPGRAARLAAWVPPLAAVTVGLLPAASLHALLGVG